MSPMPCRSALVSYSAAGRRGYVALLLMGGFLLTACQIPRRMSQSSIPEELHIVGAAGSLLPGGVNQSMRITADGQGRFTRYRSDLPAAAPTDDVPFELSKSWLEVIWRVVQEQDFFSLAPRYVDEHARDGSYAILTITAHGRTHRVEVRNMRQAQFETPFQPA